MAGYWLKRDYFASMLFCSIFQFCSNSFSPDSPWVCGINSSTYIVTTFSISKKVQVHLHLQCLCGKLLPVIIYAATFCVCAIKKRWSIFKMSHCNASNDIVCTFRGLKTFPVFPLRVKKCFCSCYCLFCDKGRRC